MQLSLSPGDVVAEKLRIVKLLGEGGMGAVYEVEHLFTKHRRALKMLHGEVVANPDSVERFLREASAAGRIGSAHIVETFDAGRLPSGEPYLVMELLEGESLAQRLLRKKRLSVDESLEIIIQAAEGVQAAHDAGIVHRDLKPDNLFLTQSSPHFLKILDFGISKFDTERFGTRNVTQEGALLGTPYYMAPEQVRGGGVDGASDVYALGVVMYECLTGEKPFVAATLPELSVKIFQGSYAPPESLRDDLPPRVCDQIARTMAREKEDRPQSATALKDELIALRDAQQQGVEKTIAAPSMPPPSGMGGTLLLDSEPKQAVTEKSRDPQGASLGGLATTGHVPQMQSGGAVSRKRWLPAVALGAAALIGGGIYAMRSQGGTGDAVGAEPSASDTAPGATPSSIEIASSTAPWPSAAKSALPAPSASVPTLSDGGAAGAAKSGKPPKSGATGPKKVKPTPGNRAEKEGIAGENPFE